TASGSTHVGLSWMVDHWGNERVIGHGGGTVGQLAFLQVLPERRFAVCLLTNSGTGGLLWRDVGGWLFEELAGVSMLRVPRPTGEALVTFHDCDKKGRPAYVFMGRAAPRVTRAPAKRKATKATTASKATKAAKAANATKASTKQG